MSQWDGGSGKDDGQDSDKFSLSMEDIAGALALILLIIIIYLLLFVHG